MSRVTVIGLETVYQRVAVSHRNDSGLCVGAVLSSMNIMIRREKRFPRFCPFDFSSLPSPNAPSPRLWTWTVRCLVARSSIWEM